MQLPPFNRRINLMRNDTFMQSNRVFEGQLRINKRDGYNTSEHKEPIDPDDVKKIYDQYFTPQKIQREPRTLQHKVFYEMIFFLGKRGRENLAKWKKTDFTIKTNAQGLQYVIETRNEATKKKGGQ